MRPELERFAMFAYDALQNDGWDDIEVDYYHSDIPPHDVYGVPIRLFKGDRDEESGAEAKYQLVMKCFCHRSGEDAYDIRLWVGADDPYYNKCNSFDEFKKCYEEALATVKRGHIKESLDFVDAIDFANNLRHYDEGAGDVIHKVGTGIKNFFGTKAGQASRANTDAQTALNTAKTNQQAQKTNAQTNAINNALDDLTLAKNLNDVVTDALGIVEKGLASLPQQEPKPNNQKPKPQDNNNENNNAVEQRVADNEAGKNGNKADVEDTEYEVDSFMESQVIDFVNAFREAANTNTKAFYNKASKSLKAIQAELRPFLTGQKDFTVADLDKISNLINDQSISAVLGKNDKKALQTIQNVNSMIKNKKISIGDDGSTAQNQQAQNPQPDKTSPTAEGGAGTEQGNSGAGDANKVSQDNVIVGAINRFIGGKGSVDDLIAYVQTLKK